MYGPIDKLCFAYNSCCNYVKECYDEAKETVGAISDYGVMNFAGDVCHDTAQNLKNEALVAKDTAITGFNYAKECYDEAKETVGAISEHGVMNFAGDVCHGTAENLKNDVFIVKDVVEEVRNNLDEEFFWVKEQAKNTSIDALSKIGKSEIFQGTYKSYWNKMPESTRDKIDKLGNNITFGEYCLKLNPYTWTDEDLSTENICGFLNEATPAVKTAATKALSSYTDVFPNIDNLNPKDATWIQFAYCATDKAKGAIPINSNYETIIHDTSNERINGYEVFVQRSEKDGRIIISYKDTDEEKDIKSDIQLASNKRPEQLDFALATYKEIIKKYPEDEIIITGHSLGGSLAELVCSSPEAQQHGKTRGFVFNSYGTKENLAACGAGYRDIGNVIGVVSQNDYLIAKCAQHVGQTYSVPSTNYVENMQEASQTAVENFIGAVADSIINDGNVRGSLESGLNTSKDRFNYNLEQSISAHKLGSMKNKIKKLTIDNEERIKLNMENDFC